MARAALLVLALAACGRFGFDDHVATGADASSPGPDRDVGGERLADPDASDAPSGDAVAPAPFDPQVGGCTAAAAGPLAEVSKASAPSGSGYGVWSAGAYVLSADTTGGLDTFAFAGSALTHAANIPDLGWVEDIWRIGSDTYFVSSPGTGLYYVHLTSDGQPGSLVLDQELTEARRGGGTADRYYVPLGGSGLVVARFGSNGFATLEGPLASNGWAEAARPLGDGHVLFADENQLRLVMDNGAELFDDATPSTSHAGFNRVWSDGQTAFAADADGVTAYRIDPGALTELATYPTAGAVRDVWSDGQHVFAVDESGTLTALGFAGGVFTLLGTAAIDGLGLGVFGDGTYIYANSSATGVHAYSGFACHSW